MRRGRVSLGWGAVGGAGGLRGGRCLPISSEAPVVVYPMPEVGGGRDGGGAVLAGGTAACIGGIARRPSSDEHRRASVGGRVKHAGSAGPRAGPAVSRRRAARDCRRTRVARVDSWGRGPGVSVFESERKKLVRRHVDPAAPGPTRLSFHAVMDGRFARAAWVIVLSCGAAPGS